MLPFIEIPRKPVRAANLSIKSMSSFGALNAYDFPIVFNIGASYLHCHYLEIFVNP
jgi:hypothetical protein